MAEYKRYFPGTDRGDEPYMSVEERDQKILEQRLARCRTEFHSDFDFDKAVEALEKFDAERWNRYPIPGEVRQYGEQRIYFKVFDNVRKLGSDSVSVSLLMEESQRFGVDVTVILSDMHFDDVTELLVDSAIGGTENRYFNEIKKLLGVEVPNKGKEMLQKFKKSIGLGEK